MSYVEVFNVWFIISVLLFVFFARVEFPCFVEIQNIKSSKANTITKMKPFGECLNTHENIPRHRCQKISENFVCDLVKPVCNDHLSNKIYYLWFIQ